MVKPTEAVKELWKRGFFEKYRQTNEVREKVWSLFHLNNTNWTDILKKCKFLNRTSKGWRQKGPFLDDDDKLCLITGEKPWTDRNKEFIKLIEKLKGEILILDPYYGLGTLHILSNFPRNKKVRFMTSQLGRDENLDKLKKELINFKKEFKNTEIKVYPKFYELHDRYIISDNLFILIGHGLKDLGNKECFLLALPIKEVSRIANFLKNSFNQRWRISQRLS